MSLRHKRSTHTLMSCVFNCFPEKFLREKNVALLQARRTWDAERGNRYNFTRNITSVSISLSSDCAIPSMILSALSDTSGRTPSPDMKPVLATVACKQHSWVNRGLSAQNSETIQHVIQWQPLPLLLLLPQDPTATENLLGCPHDKLVSSRLQIHAI